MYGKIFNRLTQGSHKVKEPNRTLQQCRDLLTSKATRTSDKEPNSEQVWIKPRASRSNERLNLPENFLHPTSSSGDKNNVAKSKSFCNEQDFNKSQKKQMSTAVNQYTDQYWMSFVSNHQYINWLKVGLALRSVCEFVSPVIEEIVRGLHASILHKHKTPQRNDRFPHSPKIKNDHKYMQDVLSHHRSPPNFNRINRISDVEKWTSQDGAWEIARVFMTKYERIKEVPNCSSASCFDVSALLKFLYNCKLVDGYVNDFQNVKRLLQVRNFTMHSPRLAIDDVTLNESFDAVLNLLQDQNLKKHVGRYLETSNFIRGVEELKTFNFDLVATAKHSLAVLDDEVYSSTSNERQHPASQEIASLQRALKRFVHQDALTSTNWKSLRRIKLQKKKVNDHTLPFFRIKPTTDNTISQPQVSAAKTRYSTSDSSYSTTETDESDPDADHSLRLSALVQGSTSFHSPNDCMKGLNDPHNCVSETVMLPNTDNLSSSSSTEESIKVQEVGPSTSLMFVPSANPTPLRYIQANTKRKLEDLMMDEPYQTILKRKKNSSGSDKNNMLSKELKSRELIPLSGINKKFGGDGGTISYKKKLQRFLRKQSNNPGAVFNVDKHNGKHYCSVSFQSNFAISSRALALTEKEAVWQAAIEARRWVLGDYKVKDGATAKLWFDAYAIQVVGRKPIYTCTRIQSDRYKTYIHLMKNHLFTEEIDDSASFKIFIEATCVSSNPSVDVESAVVATALQGIKFPLENQTNNRKMLNEFCLRNGGTIPVVHTNAIWHPRTAKMSWKSTLRSFISRSLSQEIEQIEAPNYENEKKTASNAFLLAKVYADFIPAETPQAAKTPLLAEESAAGLMLEKLGCPMKHILNNQGKCKRQLEVYVYEMDYSVVYHTVQINGTQEPSKYECVVASTCLYDTKNKFDVAADEKGFPNEEAAVESAAQNALHLLGIEPTLLK